MAYCFFERRKSRPRQRSPSSRARTDKPSNQVAASLPFVLFTPAGVVADLTDSRRLLIVAEIALLIVIAVFATLVPLGRVTPAMLLLATSPLSAGISLSAPAWHSIIPLFVNRSELEVKA